MTLKQLWRSLSDPAAQAEAVPKPSDLSKTTVVVISDGRSTDGNSTEYAEQIKASGVAIVCFYITDHDIVPEKVKGSVRWFVSATNRAAISRRLPGGRGARRQNKARAEFIANRSIVTAIWWTCWSNGASRFPEIRHRVLAGLIISS